MRWVNRSGTASKPVRTSLGFDHQKVKPQPVPKLLDVGRIRTQTLWGRRRRNDDIWLSRQAGGRRVLKVMIAEDNRRMADLIEEALVGHGYEVCGISRTVAEAVALARLHKPDLAILDLRLADGGLGTGIAEQLRPFGKIGVLYATGSISQVILTDIDGAASLSKPYRTADLLRSLEIVTEIVTTGTASPPFPRGFQVLHPATGAPLRVLV